MSDDLRPFYFAVPHRMPTAQRAEVPGHIATEFGVRGSIEFIRAEDRYRLYRIV